MTIRDARRAYGEMATDPEHVKEIEEMLDEAESRESHSYIESQAPKLLFR